MLNLSEVVSNYISTYFNDQKKGLIYRAFFLFETYEVPDYEEPYRDILDRVDGMSYEHIQDLFNARVIKDIVDIIERMGIHISRDYEVEIYDVLPILELLLLLENLENPCAVIRITNSTLGNEDKLVALMEIYGTLNDRTLRELVEEIDDEFFERLAEVCDNSPSKETIKDEEEEIAQCYLDSINRFKEFVGEEKSLGIELWNQGYKNQKLPELMSLIHYDIPEHITKVAEDNPAQAALDVLGLLLITTDDCSDIRLKLDSNISVLYTSPMQLTQGKHIIEQMLADFNNYKETLDKMEEDNDSHL